VIPRGRRRETPEKREQRWVMDCFLKAGMRVYNLSQPRATMQTEGLPDLWIFCPRRSVGFWFEVKPEGKGLEPAQQLFRDLCLTTNVRHFWGGLDAARGVLQQLGLTWAPDPPQPKER
jgi:hypothetical protein